MSELKVINAYLPTFDADHNEMILVSHTKENYVPAKQMEFYLKSEADKVIAELEADYKEACDRLQTANLIKDEQLAATRHHKYKRCLDMSEICCEKKNNCYNRALRKYNKTEADYLVRKSDFWQDWEFRWLKIAKKFKEAK